MIVKLLCLFKLHQNINLIAKHKMADLIILHSYCVQNSKYRQYE